MDLLGEDFRIFSRFSGILRSTMLTLASVYGAVDVSVIMQLKFQQSFVEFYLVPHLQFIDRVVFFFQLLHRDRAYSANCAKPEIPQCSSLRRS